MRSRRRWRFELTVGVGWSERGESGSLIQNYDGGRERREEVQGGEMGWVGGGAGRNMWSLVGYRNKTGVQPCARPIYHITRTILYYRTSNQPQSTFFLKKPRSTMEGWKYMASTLLMYHPIDRGEAPLTLEERAVRMKSLDKEISHTNTRFYGKMMDRPKEEGSFKMIYVSGCRKNSS
ncbi:hypothetical protein ACLB2K_067369 [Fragaria x ananassa]